MTPANQSRPKDDVAVEGFRKLCDAIVARISEADSEGAEQQLDMLNRWTALTRMQLKIATIQRDLFWQTGG